MCGRFVSFIRVLPPSLGSTVIIFSAIVKVYKFRLVVSYMRLRDAIVE
jgi:hypothetical protein